MKFTLNRDLIIEHKGRKIRIKAGTILENTGASNVIEWLWFTPANGSIKSFNIELWSPDFRSNKPEVYKVIAPNKEWAVIQALSTSYTGNTIDADAVTSYDNEALDMLENVISPENVTVSVDGQSFQNWKLDIIRMLNVDFGIAL